MVPAGGNVARGSAGRGQMLSVWGTGRPRLGFWPGAPSPLLTQDVLMCFGAVSGTGVVLQRGNLRFQLRCSLVALPVPQFPCSERAETPGPPHAGPCLQPQWVPGDSLGRCRHQEGFWGRLSSRGHPRCSPPRVTRGVPAPAVPGMGQEQGERTEPPTSHPTHVSPPLRHPCPNHSTLGCSGTPTGASHPAAPPPARVHPAAGFASASPPPKGELSWRERNSAAATVARAHRPPVPVPVPPPSASPSFWRGRAVRSATSPRARRWFWGSASAARSWELPRSIPELGEHRGHLGHRVEVSWVHLGRGLSPCCPRSRPIQRPSRLPRAALPSPFLWAPRV